MFILVSKADKIFLTQDRVLHRGALDAAQCHRAYAQVTMPFGLGWIRAFNEPFLRKGDDGWRFFCLENHHAKVTEGGLSFKNDFPIPRSELRLDLLWLIVILIYWL